MRNIDKYKKDLERLIFEGELLLQAIYFEALPSYEKNAKETLKEGYAEYRKKIPSFKAKYQTWYTESLIIIEFILPARLEDFKKHYQKPKTRKEINIENYSLEDYLQGLSVSYGGKVITDQSAGISRFEQQLHILKSANQRFESSLFDIKQLLQADLFDSELDAATELNKKGFVRGAGAVAGVVLEAHLKQVCENHKTDISKKHPTINDYNQSLKDSNVLDIPTWRFIQRLGDLRNLCDHDKSKDPIKDQISELIEGVAKIMKTVF